MGLSALQSVSPGLRIQMNRLLTYLELVEQTGNGFVDLKQSEILPDTASLSKPKGEVRILHLRQPSVVLGLRFSSSMKPSLFFTAVSMTAV